MEPLITVIIPIYNVEDFLECCLSSVCNQTYNNLEIILVDDGSTDDSLKLCRDYKLLDSRITVLHKENGGLSSARNYGLSVAKGNYVIFVDSDDFISRDCIEYLYNLIKKYSVDLAVGNYTRTYNYETAIFDFLLKDENIEICDGREACKRLFKGDNVQMVSAWGSLYKIELFNDIYFPEGLLHEDEATSYKIYMKSNKVAISNKIIYGYYYNTNSITTSPKKKNYTDLCIIFEQQICYFEELGDVELLSKVQNRYCIQIADHLFPINFYDNYKHMKIKSMQIYNRIYTYRFMSYTERMKGFLCGKLCICMGFLIYMKKRCKYYKQLMKKSK